LTKKQESEIEQGKRNALQVVLDMKEVKTMMKEVEEKVLALTQCAGLLTTHF
jgi:hypothetical protein